MQSRSFARYYLLPYCQCLKERTLKGSNNDKYFVLRFIYANNVINEEPTVFRLYKVVQSLNSSIGYRYSVYPTLGFATLSWRKHKRL